MHLTSTWRCEQRTLQIDIPKIICLHVYNIVAQNYTNYMLHFFKGVRAFVNVIGYYMVYGAVSVPLYLPRCGEALNMRAKNRAGTIGEAQFQFAHVHKGIYS